MNLCVVGTGRIAARAVREIQTALRPDIDICAVVNPNKSHASEFVRINAVGDPVAADDECMSQDPSADPSLNKVYIASDISDIADKIDAVYIASPHVTHYTYAKEALLAGKHVLCEKPLAFDQDQVRELYDIADKGNLIFMEAIKTSYCPGFKKIEEIIAQGDIGEVVDVDAAFTRLTAPGGREYADTQYGGAFTEFGSYTMLPVFRFLGTDDYDVSFYSRPADFDGGVDAYTRVMFDYGDRYASAKTGLAVKSEGQLVISGTKGYILVPSPWWLTRYFEVRYEDPSKIERYECEFEGDGLRYEFAELERRIGQLCMERDSAVYAEQTNTTPDNTLETVIRSERSEAISRAGVYGRFLVARENSDIDR